MDRYSGFCPPASSKQRLKNVNDDIFSKEEGYITPFGINNLGNTCFMNSALQCLLSLPIFIKNIDQLILSSTRPILLQAFKNFIGNHYPAQVKQIVSEKNPDFIGMTQQDSYEFAISFIDAISDENQNGIKDLFIGESTSISKCEKCGREEPFKQIFSSIFLSINETRRVTYVPFSMKGNVIRMFKDPINLSSDKFFTKNKINNYILMGKKNVINDGSKYFLIDQISPEFTEIYAFELPPTKVRDDFCLAIVEVETNDGHRITSPFICEVPFGAEVTEEELKIGILERLNIIIRIGGKDKLIEKIKMPKKNVFKLCKDQKDIENYPLSSDHITIIVNDKYLKINNRTPINHGNKVDLVDLFNSHSRMTQLEQGCLYKIDECGHSTRVYQKIKYTKLPKILLFLIKRSTGIEMSPEKTSINYPRTMSIILKDDFDEMISNPTDETIDNVYELRSISHHMGSYRGGHYWAYGKRGQKWYDFNDTFCEEISNPYEKTESSHFVFYQLLEDNNDTDSETDKKEAPLSLFDQGFVSPFTITKESNLNAFPYFMSSALQSLLSLPLFVEKINKILKKSKEAEILIALKEFIYYKQIDIIQKVVSQKKIIDNFQNRDSFQFIIFFIGALCDENPTLFDLFNGEYKTITKCNKCGRKEEKTQPFSYIFLSINESRRVVYVPLSLNKNLYYTFKKPNLNITHAKGINNVKFQHYYMFGKKDKQFHLIEKVSPEYSEIYAFELPSEKVEDGCCLTIVQAKTKDKRPISSPFICKFSLEKFNEDDMKNVIFERLKEIADKSVTKDSLIEKVKIRSITKSPSRFTLLPIDKDFNKYPFSSEYVTVILNKTDFMNRKRIDLESLVDLPDLFNSNIKQSQLAEGCSFKIDECVNHSSRALQRIKYTKFPKIILFKIVRSIGKKTDETNVNFPDTIYMSADDDFNKLSKENGNGVEYELRSISHYKSFFADNFWSFGKRGEKWYNFDKNCFYETDDYRKQEDTSSFAFYQMTNDQESATEAQQNEPKSEHKSTEDSEQKSSDFAGDGGHEPVFGCESAAIKNDPSAEELALKSSSFPNGSEVKNSQNADISVPASQDKSDKNKNAIKQDFKRKNISINKKRFAPQIKPVSHEPTCNPTDSNVSPQDVTPESSSSSDMSGEKKAENSNNHKNKKKSYSAKKILKNDTEDPNNDNSPSFAADANDHKSKHDLSNGTQIENGEKNENNDGHNPTFADVPENKQSSIAANSDLSPVIGENDDKSDHDNSNGKKNENLTMPLSQKMKLKPSITKPNVQKSKK